MSQRTKLDFKILSLPETARRLGIPLKRRRRILTLVGQDLNGIGVPATVQRSSGGGFTGIKRQRGVTTKTGAARRKRAQGFSRIKRRGNGR